MLEMYTCVSHPRPVLLLHSFVFILFIGVFFVKQIEGKKETESVCEWLGTKINQLLILIVIRA